MTISLMICIGRSGGTILNQCLGSIPNIVMLSEVNPLGGGSGKDGESYHTVNQQAANWYQIELKADDFAESILELESICKDRNMNLIVRDWSFINFMPRKENNYNPPQRLLALEALEGRCNLNYFTFVRDAIDVWISFGTPPADDFFSRYLKYVETIVNAKIPVFKYEQFCQNPNLIIYKIGKLLNIDPHRFDSKNVIFDKVNGDIQIQSRGRIQKAIKPLPRKNISRAKIKEINQCKDMIISNELLGYPTNYYSVDRENLIVRSVDYLFRNMKKLQNKKFVIDS